MAEPIWLRLLAEESKGGGSYGGVQLPSKARSGRSAAQVRQAAAEAAYRNLAASQRLVAPTTPIGGGGGLMSDDEWKAYAAQQNASNAYSNELLNPHKPGLFEQAVGKIIEVVDTPRAFAVSGIKEGLDALGVTDGNASWDDFTSQGWRNMGYGEVVQALQDSDSKWAPLFRGPLGMVSDANVPYLSDFTQGVEGFAGDVVFDPLTWATLGTAKAGTLVGKGAAEAAELASQRAVTRAIEQGSRKGIAMETVKAVDAAIANGVVDAAEATRLAQAAAQKGRGAFTRQGLKAANVSEETMRAITGVAPNQLFRSTIGVGGARISLPGGSSVAQRIQQVKTGLRLTVGDGVGSRLSTLLFSENLGQRQFMEALRKGGVEALDGARGLVAISEARRLAETAMDEARKYLESVFKPHEIRKWEKEGANILHEAEMFARGVDINDPRALKLQQTFDHLHELSTKYGLDLNYRPGYVPHVMTVDARYALRDPNNWERFKKMFKDAPDRLESFQMSRLDSRTIREINDEYFAVFGHNLLETSPSKILNGYMESMQRAMLRKGYEKGLEVAGVTKLMTKVDGVLTDNVELSSLPDVVQADLKARGHTFQDRPNGPLMTDSRDAVASLERNKRTAIKGEAQVMDEAAQVRAEVAQLGREQARKKLKANEKALNAAERKAAKAAKAEAAAREAAQVADEAVATAERQLAAAERVYRLQLGSAKSKARLQRKINLLKAEISRQSELARDAWARHDRMVKGTKGYAASEREAIARTEDVYDAAQALKEFGDLPAGVNRTAEVQSVIDKTNANIRMAKGMESHNMEWVPARDLEGIPGNAVDPQTVQALADDIRVNGFREPIRVEVSFDDGGKIRIGEGNHRLAAAKMLGMDEVPVVVVRNNGMTTGKAFDLTGVNKHFDMQKPSKIGLRGHMDDGHVLSQLTPAQTDFAMSQPSVTKAASEVRAAGVGVDVAKIAKQGADDVAEAAADTRAWLQADATDVRNAVERVRDDLVAVRDPKAPSKPHKSARKLAATRAERMAERDAARLHSQRVLGLFDDPRFAEVDGVVHDLAALEAQAAIIDMSLLKNAPLGSSSGYTSQINRFQKMIDSLKDAKFRDKLVADQGYWAFSDQITQAPEFFRYQAKVKDPKWWDGLLREYDKFMNFWKSYAVASPGFVTRNLYSGLFNMYLDGVNLANLRIVRRAGDTLSELEQGARGFDELRDDFVTAFTRKNPKVSTQRANQLFDAMAVARATGWSQATSEASVFGAGRITNNAFTRKFRQWGGDAEGLMRTTHALDELERGGSLMTATQRVEKWHFNYNNLSDFDRAAKRLIPFWTFFSRNMALQAQVWTTMPQKLNRSYFNLQRQLQQGNTQDPGTPGWMLELMPSQVGDANPGGTTHLFAPDLPSLRFGEDLAKIDPMNPLRIASDFAPLPKFVVEQATGKKSFTGYPFNTKLTANGQPREAPEWAQIPGVAQLLESVNLAERNDAGQLLMSDATQYKLENWVPILGRSSRLMPTTEAGQEKIVQSIASFLGVPYRGVRETDRRATRTGQMYDQRDRLAYERMLRQAGITP